MIVSTDQRTKGTPEAPISIGTGFLALDWLLIGADRVRPNEVSAGGSCGNVMAILAFLGWNSYPVARLGRDSRSEKLVADLRRFNVHTDFVLRRAHGITPVIVVRIKEGSDGELHRRYEWKHPSSGEWLPRYRPLPKGTAIDLADQLPTANIFYFDRAEPSSLVLAQSMQKSGSIVFFEPSSNHNFELFSECLAVSDIVKYSSERFPDPPRNPLSKSPRLEIQTLGDSGLRYRLKLGTNNPGPWNCLPAFDANPFVDSTGCGDWCSAGIIHKLCQSGRENFLSIQQDLVTTGLQFGQALASINCRFRGARAPMYELDKEAILAEAEQLARS